MQQGFKQHLLEALQSICYSPQLDLGWAVDFLKASVLTAAALFSWRPLMGKYLVAQSQLVTLFSCCCSHRCSCPNERPLGLQELKCYTRASWGGGGPSTYGLEEPDNRAVTWPGRVCGIAAAKGKPGEARSKQTEGKGRVSTHVFAVSQARLLLLWLAAVFQRR